jgi:hypothetical protein
MGPGTTAAQSINPWDQIGLGKLGPSWDTAAGTAGTSGIGDALGKVVDYAGNHPVVALGALQAAGSFLAGAGNQLTPAQANAYNAQANQNNAQAAQEQAQTALIKQQTANLSQPRPTASSLPPITGTPQPIIPPGQSGLINRVPFLPITGAPA